MGIALSYFSLLRGKVAILATLATFHPLFTPHSHLALAFGHGCWSGTADQRGPCGHPGRG
jgi:hypothetical protein